VLPLPPEPSEVSSAPISIGGSAQSVWCSRSIAASIVAFIL